MRLSAALLPTLLGAALAASNVASVYLFQKDSISVSNPPALSPEQARLVFAQRLGVSQYHDLGDLASDGNTLSYINKFGGRRESFFEAATSQDEAAELVLIVEGIPKYAEPMLKAAASKPVFTISNPPSVSANKKLAVDLNEQAGEEKECALEDAINPFEVKCWNGKSKVIHFDLAGKAGSMTGMLMSVQGRITRWASKGEMNTIVVLVPETTGSVESAANPYGSYEVPSQARLGARDVAEEIMSISDAEPAASSQPELNTVQDSNSTKNFTNEPIFGVPPLCHSSLDACVNATNGCSGHGECYKKYGTAGKDACFTCGCVPQNETFSYGANGEKKGFKLTYYGGAACQKKDVSSAFWLIATSTVVLIGIVGAAIGMLFSIGEEKLPGVIGAGVSSNRVK